MRNVLIVTVALGLAACSETTRAPGPGSLGIVTTTTGLDPDKDGYVVVLDNDSVGSIGANATRVVDSLAADSVTVALTGVAPNCVVLVPNERTVHVRENDTSYTSFGVECTQVFGTMHLSLEVTGQNLDSDFTTVLDGTDTTRHVSGPRTFTLPTGNHYIDLLDVAGNCQVTPGVRQVFDVPEGGDVAVSYLIDCT